jgi:hypothetical protein
MSDNRYVWKNGQLEIKDESTAQEAGEALAQIERRYGSIKPETVIKEAGKPRNPLHKFFEWDDTKAAHEHRLWQARSLIKSVHVKIIGDTRLDKAVRAFVNVPSNDGKDRQYENIVSVMSDTAKREYLLKKAENEIKNWRDRYEDLEEFSLVFSAIDDTLSAAVPPPAPASRRGRRVAAG